MVDFLSSSWKEFCCGGRRFDGHRDIGWYIRSPGAVEFEETELD